MIIIFLKNMVKVLKYSNTNTYLIKGTENYILFDTAGPGTFEQFCEALKECRVHVRDIKYLLISHFHADHMGIAGDIGRLGVTIIVIDKQKDYIHGRDEALEKDINNHFNPINDSMIKIISIDESRNFLKNNGIDGEILYTPGHSDDSISIYLDGGTLLAGDLNPLSELSKYRGTLIEGTWDNILKYNPQRIFYGHGSMEIVDNNRQMAEKKTLSESKEYVLVEKIIKYIDKGCNVDKIRKKTGADREFIEDVMRMYLTHQNISVQGVLNRIEIKNK